MVVFRLCRAPWFSYLAVLTKEATFSKLSLVPEIYWPIIYYKGLEVEILGDSPNLKPQNFYRPKKGYCLSLQAIGIAGASAYPPEASLFVDHFTFLVPL